MAQVPTNQLVMLKLLCNQTAENMGMALDAARSARCSTASPATPRRASTSSTRAQDVGFRQAVRERDDPFGDYGSRPRSRTAKRPAP